MRSETKKTDCFSESGSSADLKLSAVKWTTVSIWDSWICSTRAQRANAASTHRPCHWLSADLHWRTCSRRGFMSCLEQNVVIFSQSLHKDFSAAPQPLSRGFPGSSGIRVLSCSLLFVCSTWQGCSPMEHSDKLTLGAITDPWTTEMFCSLMRASVFGDAAPRKLNWSVDTPADGLLSLLSSFTFLLFCNAKPPAPSPSSTECRWMALTPALSAWHGSEQEQQELKSLQISFGLWDFSLWFCLRAFNSHSESNLHLHSLCSSFNCGWIWTRGAHMGFDDNRKTIIIWGFML